MPSKPSPNLLLKRLRDVVKDVRKEGEEGICKPDRMYERVEELLVALDESGKAGDLPDEWRPKESGAKKILLDGLKYHEHDGHNMPKSVAREALVALGVPLEEQLA